MEIVVALFLIAACGGSGPDQQQVAPERRTMEIDYVTSPELAIHKSPDAASPIIMKVGNGQAVSVLSKRGDWVEIRTADGSGWARAGEMSNTSEPGRAGNTIPRFRRAPEAAQSPNAHGEIVFEAQVNTDGDVVGVKTLSNTTGSAALELQNRTALLAAKFYPITQRGERIPFTYEHRVHY
jgi:hypothetical protein